MPWSIQQRDGQYCVVKQGESKPVPGGCHASRVDAIKHQRALYANEPSARTAAAGTEFPLRPPRDWFETPEPDHPQPMNVSIDGHVTGHLAPWEGCHVGFGDCTPPPRSSDGYRMFHLGQVETAEGDLVSVGKVVYNGKHAPLTASLAAATQHYDDNRHVGAYVRALDGRHGIWLSGAVKHDIPPEGLRDFRANPPSGDWRMRNGRWTLIAALAVPIPGYQIAHAASAEQQNALILSYPGDDPEPRSREFIRQRALIASGLGECKTR